MFFNGINELDVADNLEKAFYFLLELGLVPQPQVFMVLIYVQYIYLLIYQCFCLHIQ